eukprot:CAMPEP_0172608976 /NCGR_PEP_ID=MMETSP1068-20121228/29018_1 /TAXON_ID=35684 /ORGANISM="Pseudopedinella elastica, Strain CCMP716" /LENGTH=84 /DNA_ID=CAMNT_0013412395 /DNA_START=210 /DNA_END=464 /DNA_ORIENTATION=+
MPSHMRELGDAYVKREFRQHQNAKPEFLPGFFSAWESYVKDLSAKDESAGFGRPIESKKMNAMTEEQRMNMEKLKDEARKARNV